MTPARHAIARLAPAALVLVLACASAPAQRPVAGYQCINLRSGGDQGITFAAAQGPMVPLSNAAFTAGDFAGACGGLPAAQVTSTSSWLPALPADAAARWISINPVRTPRSTLFCQSFDLPACTLQSATLQFWFAADDQLGDPTGGPNPIGVYLNGQPVTGFAGGSYAAQTALFHGNVGPLLVPGTNRLQVYQRDMGASLGGVIWSARICYLPCQPPEVVRLRSGNGAIGGPDGQIKQFAGLPATPIKPTLITPVTDPLFAAAASGVPAQVVSAFPNQWCGSLAADPQAKWIASDAQRAGRSVLYSQAFTVASCAIQSATLRFDFGVDDAIGDLGAPGNVGLYLNGQPVAGSIVNGSDGSQCGLSLTANVTGLVTSGANALQVYVSDDDGVRAGIVYSAQLSIVPCIGPETIVVRSGPSQNIRYMNGPAGAPLSTVPFTPGDFALANAGPLAVTGTSLGIWCQSLPCDPQAQWMGITSAWTPYSALYAQPFTVTTCPGSIKRVKLEICFAADDQLGDPPLSGGGNQCGIYVNGQPVPLADSFGNYATATSFTAMIPATWVNTGANTLYIYNRDLGASYSGVLYSCKITILPCTPFIVYGDGCGNPPPTLAMRNNPEPGAPLDVRIATGAPFTPAFTIIGASDVSWNGIPLPFDLTPFGANGCSLLTSLDLQLPFLLTDALGEASFSLPIPDDASLVGQTLFFQTIAADPRANALGLAMSAGHAMTVQRPGT